MGGTGGADTPHTHIRAQGAGSEAPATDSGEKICVWRSLLFWALSPQEPLCPVLRQPDDKEAGKRRESEVDGSLFPAPFCLMLLSFQDFKGSSA